MSDMGSAHTRGAARVLDLLVLRFKAIHYIHLKYLRLMSVRKSFRVLQCTELRGCPCEGQRRWFCELNDNIQSGAKLFCVLQEVTALLH